jgi:hypothetical protein
MEEYKAYERDDLPWVRYRALLDLEGLSPEAPEAVEARLAMENSVQLQALLESINPWPGTVLNSHKSASQGFHSLSFLAELGVSPEHPALAAALKAVYVRMGEDGMPRLPMTYPEHFGGTGREEWCWALCDAPLLLKALVRLGYGSVAKVAAGVRTIFGLAKPFGWPCAVSPELGGFRGPGRKEDPCPFANLICLDLAAACAETPGADPFPGGIQNEAALKAGIASLLACWERSLDWHPYMFYAGADFRKLKAPFVWYDILHVADALSRFPSARNDTRFAQMLAAIRSKRKDDGSYWAESVYMPYKAWDFGQKKGPSPWLALIVERIERRASA